MDGRLEVIKRTWEESAGLALTHEDVEWLIQQAEMVHDLQEYRNVNAKFLVDLNEFLQQRSKQMPINEVWGLHVADVAIKYIRQLENEKARESLKGESE
ncbi:hypothetical protein [Oceanobacillus sp. J11TS1]|uniref:hypothetical protein n=1 Tax=Oceanobacillus sp. J11TS1 TaxID=2807191 RepID=UPI001BB401A9|nr:hypothetical protein [Oceanobacillus sp. J11TS1]